MGRPPPCVLFAQSFLHPRLAEYVDEVRFTEPVVICACEILELHTSSVCPTLSLSGASSPPSFALEIFIRSGGEARFKRLCPAFLYSPSASNLLEVQAAVTDHLVIRGSYRALSLVVYGNPAKDLGQFNADHDIDSTLSELIVPSEEACKPEDLPEALWLVKGRSCGQLFPLQCLRLVCWDPELLSTTRRLLNLAVVIVKSLPGIEIAQKVFAVLLATASSCMPGNRFANAFSEWPALSAVNLQQNEQNAKVVLEKAREEIEEMYDQLQEKRKESTDQLLTTGNEVSVIETICHWLHTSFRSLSGMGNSASSVNTYLNIASTEDSLMGCLAAVQLLCMDSHWCFRFVVAGGIRFLIDVLQFSSTESSAAVLLILGAIKYACSHAFACEALLGWWPLSSSSDGEGTGTITGYAIILRLLLQAKRSHVAQLAAQVLHHLRAYELAATFQSVVEPLLDNSFMVVTDLKLQMGLNHALKKASATLKQFMKSLSAKDFIQDHSPAQRAQWLILDADDNTSALLMNATYGLIASSNYCVTMQDMNPHVLLVLKERRILPLLSALVSVPCMRSTIGHTKDLFLEFLGIVQALLLSLISCRSGLLFLSSELEAASAIVSALGGVQEVSEINFVNIRHASSLTSVGFLCHPQDVAVILDTSLSVVNSIDRLLATRKWSEDWLWALWELAVFSRTETGRQALSAITFFPEAFVVIIEALQAESQAGMVDMAEGQALKRAIVHSAAELVRVIVMDPAACTLSAWIPHALLLQKALQSCSPTNIDIAVGNHGAVNSKDTLCARLLEWVDVAAVYHKKGAVAVLRYAATLIAGSVNQLVVAGPPASDSVEPDSNVSEATGSTELPTIEMLLGRGITLGASGTILSDTAVIQLTVSMHILSSISCHPGVAAVLYGEGAMSILYIVLEYGGSFLQTSTSDYDYLVEEDGDGDETMEMLIEQGRERLLLSLLLPSLLLLLNLLRRLQATGEDYRNTRLVETLLYLHHGISSRLVSRATVPAEAGGMLVLAAVSRVLVSVLACWPVFGWSPSLFPKLLGVDSKSTVSYTSPLPLEPKEASSVLRILGEMLPVEQPQLCMNRAAAMCIYRGLAVQALFGERSVAIVRWHCQSPDLEKLIQALVPHLEQISTMVFQLACTTCDVLQDLLKTLFIRLAFVSKEHASVLVRPLLTYVREISTLGALALSVDIFQVERFLHFLMELSRHAAMKRVLLEEGIVSVLLQALNMKNDLHNGDNKSSTEHGTYFFCWSPHILNSFAAICDPYVSSVPGASLNRRLMEDCPSFEDLCSIATALLNFCKVAPVGKEMEIAVGAIGRLASHKLGRAAFASVALPVYSSSAMPASPQKDLAELSLVNTNPDSKDSNAEFVESKDFPALLCIWRRLATALEAGGDNDAAVAGLIEQVSLASIQLSAAGRSACGLGALQILCPLNLGSVCMDSGEGEKRDPFVQIGSLLEERITEAEIDKECNPSIVSQKTIYQKALTAVMVLSRLSRRPMPVGHLPERIKMVVNELCVSQEHAAATLALPPCWGALPALFSRVGEETENSLDPESKRGADETLGESLKERFTWECSAALSDRPAMAAASSKRKSGAPGDGTGKRHRVDGNSTGEVVSGAIVGLAGRTGTGSGSSVLPMNRRDTFRQRKPNTSRPPSMHVDDYVARERGNDALSAGSAINQRILSGGGRPPSIHVDEFMARQRERQPVVGAPVNSDAQVLPQPPHPSPLGKSESVTNNLSIKASRPMRTNFDELEDVNIEIDGVPDADDLLSLPGADEFVLVGREESNPPDVGSKVEETLSTTSKVPDIKTSEASGSATASQEVPVKADSPKQPHAVPVDIDSQSESTTLISTQGEERIQVSPVRIRGPHSESSGSQILNAQTPVSLGASVQVHEVAGSSVGMSVQPSLGEQKAVMHQSSIGINIPSSVQGRGGLQFPAAPPLPPTLPPPPPIPAGVIPQKFEPFISTGIEQRLLPSSSVSHSSFELPSNSSVSVGLGREKRLPLPPDYHIAITENVPNSAAPTLPPPLPPAPPPPTPPMSWPMLEPQVRRLDPAHRPPASLLSYSTMAASQPLRPSSEVTSGTQVQHTSVPPWANTPRISEEVGSSGVGRPLPPLPPTPPPFSSSPSSLLQVPPQPPSSIPPSSSLYGQPIGSLPMENKPVYVLTSGIDSSSSERRFGSFAPSLQVHHSLPQSVSLPSPFVPPLPPGRPLGSQSLLLPHQQSIHLPQVMPPPQPPPPPPAQQSEHATSVLQPQLHFQQQRQPTQQQLQQQSQPSGQVQQQESGKLLQQILASPDAIQDLLKDQNKLQRLLEQHPKLISLLQEKMGQG